MIPSGPRTTTAVLAVLLLLAGVGCRMDQAVAPTAAAIPAPTAAPTTPPAPSVVAVPQPTAAIAEPPVSAPPGASSAPDRIEDGHQPPPGQPVPPERLASFRKIEQAVARIRGLKPTAEVDLRSMNQEQLRRYLHESFERDYSPEERARDQKLLSILGLIRPDQDLVALMLGLLTDGIAGLYDEDDRRMYVIAETADPTASVKVTFAHEYTHALQDQYFNLKDLDGPEGEDDDRASAVQALVEGDATLTMAVFAREELTNEERRQFLRSQGGSGDRAFETAPLVLREQLTFPYNQGFEFVAEVHRRGGFAGVDAAFRDPPKSTEQILHPAKYFAGEAPLPITLPDLPAALGPGWQQTDASTLGELDLRILVEQFADRPAAEKAAAGWGGGRYALLEHGDQAAVALSTAWDTERDAREFFQAYADALSTRLGPGGRVLVREPDRQALAGEGFAAVVTLRGQDVLVALAQDEAVMDRLGRALAGN